MLSPNLRAEWKLRSWPVFLLLSRLFNEHFRWLERLVGQVEGGRNVNPTVVTIPHHHPLLQIPAENVKYCENQKEKNWILEVLLCLFQWMAGCSPFGSFFPSMSVSPTCGSGKNSDLSVLENESVGSILLQIERQTHAEELLVKFVPFHLVKDWLIMWSRNMWLFYFWKGTFCTTFQNIPLYCGSQIMINCKLDDGVPFPIIGTPSVIGHSNPEIATGVIGTWRHILHITCFVLSNLTHLILVKFYTLLFRAKKSCKIWHLPT